jgi:hypothetical protein
MQAAYREGTVAATAEARGGGHDERGAIFKRASEIVSEWKEANGKPLLSPEASRDLAGRTILALIEAQTEVAHSASCT